MRATCKSLLASLKWVIAASKLMKHAHPDYHKDNNYAY
jgi:hypothetical protein